MQTQEHLNYPEHLESGIPISSGYPKDASPFISLKKPQLPLLPHSEAHNLHY